LRIFGVSAIVQIVATYFAAKSFGLIGVIYTGIAVRLLQVALSAFFTKGIFRYEFNFLKIYAIPLLFLLVNVIQFNWNPVYDVRLYLIQMLLFSLLFYGLFRKEIKQVLIQFKLIKA
jgi:hypothetical protein